jgi:hypothetical protein
MVKQQFITHYKNNTNMKFEFNIDKKCTIWVKETHYVEADNREQAQEKMIALFRASNDDNFSHQEILHETLEDLSVADNDNWPTAELMDEKGDKIADNTITTMTK